MLRDGHQAYRVFGAEEGGDVLEQRLGQRAFVATFILGGASGNALFALLDGRAHVGATASIFALQGAAFSERHGTTGRWLNRDNIYLLVSFVLEVALIQVCDNLFADVFTDAGGTWDITYWAHLGGFAGGLVVMETMLHLKVGARGEKSTYAVAGLCLAALAFSALKLSSNMVSSGPFALLGGLFRW